MIQPIMLIIFGASSAPPILVAALARMHVVSSLPAYRSS